MILRPSHYTEMPISHTLSSWLYWLCSCLQYRLKDDTFPNNFTPVMRHSVWHHSHQALPPMLPCWSLQKWLSFPSMFCSGAGYKCRKTPQRICHGWRTSGGNHCRSHSLEETEGNKGRHFNTIEWEVKPTLGDHRDKETYLGLHGHGEKYFWKGTKGQLPPLKA